MLRGENVRVLVNYDLFGVDVNDETGIYIKTDENTKKLLVFFPINKEWGELEEHQVERLDPGVVPTSNQEFISRVVPLADTFPAK